MKKSLSVILVIVLMLALVVGCAKPAEAPVEPAPAPVEPVAEATGIVKLGLGAITTIDSSKDLNGDVLPLGQVDTIMAAVGFDKDDKVVSLTIDSAQSKVNFDKDLQLTTDVKAELKTKVELGDAYGMIKGSKIGKEWYQQIAELEKWMVGKTVAEIKAMKVNSNVVPEEAELTSLVSISVDGYIAVVEKAFNTAVALNSSAVKVGLGHNIDISKSKGLGKDAEGKEILPLAQVDTVMAATAFDADGKVAGTFIDNAQTKINFDNQGKVTTDKAGVFKTKVELGAEYGMIKASKIGKEWYEQAAALGQWMVGKTVAEIKAMKTVEVDAAHPAVPDVAELTSLVSVSVEHYIDAIAEGFDKAK